MSTAPETVHDYRLFGWRLRAQRPLPFLHPAEPAAGGLCDVEIRFGPVHPPDAPVVFSTPFTAVHADGVIVFVRPEGIRVRIEGGRRLTVDADPGVTAAELHTWLFGPALTMLCHQRGQPPLHAGVLDMDGRGVAVAGDAGAGKSTTARALMARGCRLLTDDQAVIDPHSRRVYPGYPSMKLWESSAAAFGDTMDPGLRVKRGAEKFHRPLADAFQPEPVPLALVVVLQPAPELAGPTVEAPTRTEAAALLHRHVSGTGFARVLDRGRAAFHWATALARRVPVRLLRRPDDLARLDEVCGVIEDLMRTVAKGNEG